MRTSRFNLQASAPFRLDLTAWVLRRREANRIDSWDGETYRRAMVLDSQTVLVSVKQKGPSRRPELEVDLACENPTSRIRSTAESILIRMLGLSIDLSGFYAMAKSDAHLKPLAEKFIGVKPPVFPTLFESIANAVIFQQISLDAGISILNRLAEAYGAALDCGGKACYLFPDARSLAGLTAEEIKRIGVTANKARALSEAARGIVERNLSFDDFEKMDNESAFGELVRFRGIGRWSADYALLRGLGRLDVFPRGDVGARSRIQRLLKPDGKLQDTELEDIISKWQSYAGLVYFHLLLAGLAEKGLIAQKEG